MWLCLLTSGVNSLKQKQRTRTCFMETMSLGRMPQERPKTLVTVRLLVVKHESSYCERFYTSAEASSILARVLISLESIKEAH